MTIDERLDRLTGIVETLAASVVSHDDHIEKLIEISERTSRGLDRAEKLHEELSRQFQAYLNTIHLKQ